MDCTDSTLLLPARIGGMPQYTKEPSLSVLDSAKHAWNGGSGQWPTLSLRDRIYAVDEFVRLLKPKRKDFVNVLMWEIGKNRKDAESEFDRTIKFIEQSIANIQNPNNAEFNSEWKIIGKTRAFVRRAAIGIILCLGPFNYPLNETYATMIPALLMGNIIIMKIPTVGGLVHLLTSSPYGCSTIYFGTGAKHNAALVKTGSVDGLAFIGGSSAADELIKAHPYPHRLKLFLQLEAKNMAIFLPDLFEEKNKDALDRAICETSLGCLSYNGQRCTALKIVFAPAQHASELAHCLAAKVDVLRIGFPWQTWQDSDGVHFPDITPLPNRKRVNYMSDLITNAVENGSKIMNQKGGSIIGGSNSTMMVPAVLYPVNENMKLYTEEQFGPIIPVTPYDDIETVIRYGREGKYGQQCSIFTQEGKGLASILVDRLVSVFGRINFNAQCGRSPDTLPFSGRRSSSLGVMSVAEASREFSVPTVVSYKDKNTEDAMSVVQRKTSFMQPLQ